MADFASIYERLNDKVAKHRANSNLSADGKKRLIAAAYVEADSALAKIKETQAAENAKARRTVESRLFGMNYYDSKDPATVMLHRDARDRASRLETPEEAIALLESSIVGGDKVMARAILGRGFQSGTLAPVLDRYVELVPDDVDSIDELLSMNAADQGAATPASRLHQQVFNPTVVPRPAELQSYPDYAISALAAEAPDVQETPPPPDFSARGGTSGLDYVRLVGGYDMATGERNTD